MIDLYILALNKAEPGTFLFAENGETAFIDITQTIADELGLGNSQPWSVEQETSFAAFGANFRIRGKKARELGWRPQYNAVLDSIKDELYPS